MIFGKQEKSIEMVELELDISDEESAKLKEYAIREIQKDDKELINYAVNKLLKQYVDERQVELLEKASKTTTKSTTTEPKPKRKKKNANKN